MESRGHGESREIVLVRSRGGRTELPEELLERLKIKPGRAFSVIFKDRMLSPTLRKRGVTEAEVEKISAVQLEPESNVVRFLTTEGALGGQNRIGRKAARLFR